MSAMQSLSPLLAGMVLTLAVGVGVTRLWLWQRSAPADQRAGPRRLVLLAALQVMAAGLLFLTLHPPVAARRDATMVVATRNAGDPAAARGEILVALPETGAVDGAERVPDLATALRRHPEAARLRLAGEGLTARDRAASALPVEHPHRPPIIGIVEMAPSPPVAPGAVFAVGGRVGSLPSGVIELADPAGQIVARAPVVAGRRFRLDGVMRTAGTAVFELRLRDAAGRVVERLDAPVQALAGRPPQVMVLAGAPDPETNFLRRWADGAGVDLTVGIDLGAGVRLGQAPARPSASELAKTDLLVMDDRSWEALDPTARGVVVSAVEGGMGLLLRPTGDLTGATRRDWALLGAPVPADGAVRPAPLAVDGDVPEPGRWEMAQTDGQAVAEVRTPDGSPLAAWRARGQGRIGLWVLKDSYMLALGGRPEVHADLWSDIFTALARPVPVRRPALRDLARVGERAVICGVTPLHEVGGTDGPAARLQVDPRAGPEGCAAFWPSRPGWVFVGSGAGERTPVYIHPADAAASLRAQEAATQTQVRPGGPVRSAAGWNGGSVAFLFALLALLAGLWFLERRRPTRRAGDTPTG